MIDPAYVVAGLVAAALVVGVLLTGPAAEDVVTEPTLLDPDGVVCTFKDGVYVPCDPAGLAKGMDMEPSAYALARVIVSEASSIPWIGQVGVAWTVRNHAAKIGRSVLDVVTRARIKKEPGTGDGFFGRQGDPTGGYRYVASSRDTNDDARETARAVMAGEIDDPTGGALNFDSPQSYGKQAGTEASGAEEFAENRRSEGKELVTLEGVAPNRLRFWRPA